MRDPVCRCAALLGVLLLAGCGFFEPIGPIAGGRLSGEVVSEPVADWSFVDNHETIKVETRPGDPYSVTTWVFHHGGNLYVPCGDPESRTWVANVQADPRVRLKIGERIYERSAVRVTDPAEFEAAAQPLLRKYDLDPPEEGEETEAWLFRMEPR
jgi:hypothetical protein